MLGKDPVGAHLSREAGLALCGLFRKRAFVDLPDRGVCIRRKFVFASDPMADEAKASDREKRTGRFALPGNVVRGGAQAFQVPASLVGASHQKGWSDPINAEKVLR